MSRPEAGQDAERGGKDAVLAAEAGERHEPGREDREPACLGPLRQRLDALDRLPGGDRAGGRMDRP